MPVTAGKLLQLLPTIHRVCNFESETGFQSQRKPFGPGQGQGTSGASAKKAKRPEKLSDFRPTQQLLLRPCGQDL